MPPKITVSIITYNHAPYIAQAIESALAQETDFDMEILIGEDGSTDGTREIVQQYKKRYPERITLFLHDRSNVITIDGQPTGIWNALNNFRIARGRYIAILDGDDYWVDPKKLQKQVDFLESHPQYSICGHDVYTLLDGKITPRRSSRCKRDTFTFEDTLERNLLPTCSVVYRNNPECYTCPLFQVVSSTDWIVQLLHAQHGLIKSLPGRMAVYRQHERSFSQIYREDKTLYLERGIQNYKYVYAYFGKRYKSIIKKAIAQKHYQLAMEYAKRGKKYQAKNHIMRYLLLHRKYGFLSQQHLYRTLRQIFIPKLSKFQMK